MSDAHNLEPLRKKLREYRFRERLTYRQLGEKVGLSMPAVRDFILGNNRNPHATTVYIIQQFLREAA